MTAENGKTAGYKYMAYVDEPYTVKNAHGTGKVYGNTLNDVRKALYQKAKTVRWHRRTYLGFYPQYTGGLWKMGNATINFSDKEWRPVNHIATLVYDTGTNRLIQGENPPSMKMAIQKWRVVRSDGSLGNYVEFSMNLI